MPDKPRQWDDHPPHISQRILEGAVADSIQIGSITQNVSIDVAAIVGVLETQYKGQLADLRARDTAYQDQIRALTEVLTTLAQKQTQPDAPPGIADALAELSQGRTAAAEAIFQRVVARKESDIQEAAEALRHLGTLAFLHDTSKALHSYRRAVELAPANAEGWNQLGHLLVRIGQLDNAIDAYRKVLALGEETGDHIFVIRAYANLGDMYQIRGDLKQAEAMYRKALELAEALGYQEGIARIYNGLGVLYRVRGDLNQAEAMHGKALELAEALGYQEGIALCYSNLGNVYRVRGDLNQAEAMYGKALTLFQEIAAAPQVEKVQDLLRKLREQPIFLTLLFKIRHFLLP